ncbi:hypothetical protein EJD96_09035 [Herbaspirillum seropedicae]|uniref:hypothetical protein n=1 Tax=Herbaspirillum seropedicae TaxID=964 RepID=UPI001121EA6A|nr:hypothetical protein [Herbaspirillum seropedicae]QDD64299.1 hypothetical protein EJD96_09035 [Herbaspirillum seropedicae]
MTQVAISSLNHIQSWEDVLPNDDRFEQTLLLSVKRNGLKEEAFLSDLFGQWISFRLTEYDGKSLVPEGSLVANLITLGGGLDGIQNVQFLLSGIKAAKQQLKRLSLLVGLNSRKKEIKDALDSGIGGEDFPLNVVIYDVGQGNANALVDEYGHPRLFFDLGWPTSLNSSSRPPCPPNLFSCERECTPVQAPVILSHWDYDHWGYAVANTDYVFGAGAVKMTFKADAISRPWIVPKPPRLNNRGKGLGPTHMRLLAALPNRIAWPNALKTVKFSAGIITRSDIKVLPADRNNQGLAWFVMQKKSLDALLLPGDLSFDRMRWPNPLPQVVGLLASHHAGAVTGITATSALKAKNQKKMAVSVGLINKHKHPMSNMLQDYQSINWHPAVRTSTRSICAKSGKQNGAILMKLNPSSNSPRFECPCVLIGNLVPTQSIP